MDVNFKTKFNLNDIVYAFYNGHIMKFRVDNVKVKFDFLYSTEISYVVTSRVSNDAHVMLQEVFDENELHTKEELIEMLEQIKEE